MIDFVAIVDTISKITTIRKKSKNYGNNTLWIFSVLLSFSVLKMFAASAENKSVGIFWHEMLNVLAWRGVAWRGGEAYMPPPYPWCRSVYLLKTPTRYMRPTPLINYSVKHLYPSVKHLHPSVKHLHPSVKHLYPSVKHLYPSVKHLYPSVKHPRPS